MLLRLFLYILFLLNTYTFFAQGYRDKFISEYKKDTINFDFITNLSVIDTTITPQDVTSYKQQIDQIVKSFPEKEIKERRERKRIKKICDEIHDALFVKYVIVAAFPEIFKNGTYNCVSATAVYAYVFDQLNIPYLLKEEPGHVFLIAYPNQYNIHLETTVPSEFGLSSFDDDDIKDIVNNLIKMKLFTNEELTQRGAREIYMEYFYGNNFVEKSALVDMQYYNTALGLYEEEKFIEALNYLKIAYLYNKSKTIDYFKNLLSFLVLDFEKFSNIKSVELLYTIFSDLEFGKDFEEADVQYFARKITRNEENGTAFFIEAAQVLKNLDNDKVKRIFLEHLYAEIMDNSLISDDLDTGLEYAQKRLDINDKNKRAQEAILYVFRKKLTILPISEGTLKQIEIAEQKHPSVKDDVTIQSFKCYNLLRLADVAYNSREHKLGGSYLAELEDTMNRLEDPLLVSHENIAIAYLSAGRYYYRFNKFDKAYKYLNKGLDYSPDNKDLNKYLRWTKEEMK